MARGLLLSGRLSEGAIGEYSYRSYPSILVAWRDDNTTPERAYSCQYRVLPSAGQLTVGQSWAAGFLVRSQKARRTKPSDRFSRGSLIPREPFRTVDSWWDRTNMQTRCRYVSG